MAVPVLAPHLKPPTAASALQFEEEEAIAEDQVKKFDFPCTCLLLSMIVI